MEVIGSEKREEEGKKQNKDLDSMTLKDILKKQISREKASRNE